MQGAALKNDRFVEAGRLVNYAAEAVPELAKGLGGVQQPIVSAPRGATPFDLGEMGPEERAKIPLRHPRPLFARSMFMDGEALHDARLHLSQSVDRALRDAQARGPEAALVFVDAAEVPSGCRLSGLYRIDQGKAEIQVRIVRDQGPPVSFQVSGPIDDPAALARSIVEEATTRIR